jgi:hypothetical protein
MKKIATLLPGSVAALFTNIAEKLIYIIPCKYRHELFFKKNPALCTAVVCQQKDRL